jgi:hypothetical protein
MIIELGVREEGSSSRDRKKEQVVGRGHCEQHISRTCEIGEKGTGVFI